MLKKIVTIHAFLMMVGTCGFAQNYKVKKISAKRIEITKALDNKESSKDAEELLAPYKAAVDSFIGPVIGHSSMYMAADRPESLLSNWAADVLLHEAKKYDTDNSSPIDFAVVNIGGLRSFMPKGDVRKGDIVDISPFMNKLVILTLKGKDVMELFRQFCIFGGEGVSHGLRIEIYDDRTLADATFNGQKIKSDKLYRIATLDYLAEGNDNMKAFKNAVNIIRTDVVVRDVYIGYVSEQEAKGEVLSSSIEGRTVIVKRKCL